MSHRRGRLFLVPNTLDFHVATVGSLPDLQEVLPLGVIRIASRLTHWVAENARTTRAFLKRVDAVLPLAQPLQSIQISELPRVQKSAKARPADRASGVEALLSPLLQGHDTGLISEAGLPAVADPGAALVRAAHAQGLVVCALPGPSSLLLALAASGLNGQSFAFVGYLPVENGARTTRIRELEALSRRQHQTQLMIETPYRNQALQAALVAALDEATSLSISCALTLPGGWSRTDTVAAWKARPVQLSNELPAVFAFLGH